MHCSGLHYFETLLYIHQTYSLISPTSYAHSKCPRAKWQMVTSMTKGKTPGHDGIPIEYVGYDFQCMILQGIESGALQKPTSFDPTNIITHEAKQSQSSQDSQFSLDVGFGDVWQVHTPPEFLHSFWRRGARERGREK
jgi:hypothetical protein